MAAAAANLLKSLRDAALKKPSPDVSTATKALGQLKVQFWVVC